MPATQRRQGFLSEGCRAMAAIVRNGFADWRGPYAPWFRIVVVPCILSTALALVSGFDVLLGTTDRKSSVAMAAGALCVSLALLAVAAVIVQNIESPESGDKETYRLDQVRRASIGAVATLTVAGVLAVALN